MKITKWVGCIISLYRQQNVYIYIYVHFIKVRVEILSVLLTPYSKLFLHLVKYVYIYMPDERGCWKQSVLMKQSSGTNVSVGIAALNYVYENLYVTSGIA
jgi:hypothetical protein